MITNSFASSEKKWTGLPRGVHQGAQLNGQQEYRQVVDLSMKVVCPLNSNLGVNIEGTLPGKA